MGRRIEEIEREIVVQRQRELLTEIEGKEIDQLIEERAEEDHKQGWLLTRDTAKRHHNRRQSVSRTGAQEQMRVVTETQAQMAREHEATKLREREERDALLRQGPQPRQHYDPREGRYISIQKDGSGINRRRPVSGSRPSLSTSNSQRRVSIAQSNPPPISISTPNQFSTCPPNSRPANPPHFVLQNPFAQPATGSGQGNPFAPPSARTTQDNPFAPSRGTPLMVIPDPWDACNMPGGTSHTGEQHQTLRQHGDTLIYGTAESSPSKRPHAPSYQKYE